MRTWTKTTIGRAALGTAAGAALLVAYGCNRSEDWTRVRAAEDPLARTVSLSEAAAPADESQVLVTCEPHQRTLVRQAVVHGRTVARVECVSDPGYAAGYGNPAAMANPAAYEPRVAGAYDPRVVTTPVYREAAPRVVRQSAPQRVVTERSSGRSVKKSAIIIGSSAGVGAGVGAAVGGKKGALIGAAIGGGSAAIWDQVTRR
jgi:hypothetical protein